MLWDDLPEFSQQKCFQGTNRSLSLRRILQLGTNKLTTKNWSPVFQGIKITTNTTIIKFAPYKLFLESLLVLESQILANILVPFMSVGSAFFVCLLILKLVASASGISRIKRNFAWRKGQRCALIFIWDARVQVLWQIIAVFAGLSAWHLLFKIVLQGPVQSFTRGCIIRVFCSLLRSAFQFTSKML